MKKFRSSDPCSEHLHVIHHVLWGALWLNISTVLPLLKTMKMSWLDRRRPFSYSHRRSKGKSLLPYEMWLWQMDQNPGSEPLESL